MRILLTGSTGNLGQKATSALVATGVDLVRIGRNGMGDPGVITADLGVWGDWARHFQGVDVVLHLAADPRAAGDWETVAPLNIDLALNVLRAAQEARVPRFVFASSNWVFGGYRFQAERLSHTLPPRPINPYGASKLFIERQGKALCEQGLHFLSLRIGYCQPGENRPGPHMAFGLWGQEMWLGNDDWAQAVTRSCAEPFEGFHAINIVSDNRGMRWDLTEARAAIGYAPTQSHSPKLSLSGWMKDRGAWLREAAFPSGSAAPSIGRRW